MQQKSYHEIIIHLESISELFSIPVPDPFSPHVRFVPGITTIQAAVTPPLRYSARQSRVTIFLPTERIEPDIANRSKEAIQRYTRFKSVQDRHDSMKLHREAFQALLAGILFLAGGLFLPDPIERALSLPAFFSTLFSEGFTLAFWVILWRPVDFFLFDASSTRKENHINKRMMKLEVIVLAETNAEFLPTPAHDSQP